MGYFLFRMNNKKFIAGEFSTKIPKENFLSPELAARSR